MGLVLSLGMGAVAVKRPTGSIVLAWDSPHREANVTWELVVVHTWQGVTSHQTLPVTTLEHPTCERHAGTSYKAKETWCTLFACTAPGAYQLALLAHRGEASSVSENGLAFGIADEATCRMISYDEALLAALATPATTSAPSPDVTTPGTETAPPEASPAPTMTIALPATMEEEEIEAMLQQLASLDAEFQTLEAQYQRDLATVRAAYDAALAEATRLSDAGQHAAAQQAYELAQQRQHEVYELTRTYWKQLLARWEHLLGTQQATAE
jgi:hypothetical protein